jgi:CheY-like chemotaxis protein/anti-sigma regulatory factor (Ser/Thr protein kinase)
LGQADLLRAKSCTQRLPALPSAAAVTRRYLKRLLGSWELAALTGTAQLVASELVSNAVTAAQAPDSVGFLDGPGPQSIELDVWRTEASVIIGVRDPNPNPPVIQQAGPMDEGGRGLFLVQSLCANWGYYPAKHSGKVVWCEIALADGAPAIMQLAAMTFTTDERPGDLDVRCVIVDDNPGFVQTARKTLENGGIVVVGAASTSTEALHQVLAAEPDVVLVDAMLGTESGFDLTRQLAAQQGSRRTPVIMISTHAKEDFADLISASPAIAFLPKWELSAAAVSDLLLKAPRADGD